MFNDISKRMKQPTFDKWEKPWKLMKQNPAHYFFLQAPGKFDPFAQLSFARNRKAGI